MGKTLIVIAGPTGSGKTDLSIQIALHYHAPIISTDSRQFYRGIPIGTAQPDAEQLQAVEHHFIASHDLKQDFNCGAYEQEALQRLEELFAQHDYVVAVGGSGLYIKALCEGMDDLPEVDPALRSQLAVDMKQLGIDAMAERLRELDPAFYEVVDRKNPARILRALEVCIGTGMPYSSLRTGEKKSRPFRIIKTALTADRQLIFDRINLRVEKMLEMGMLDEARSVYHLRHLNSLNTVGFKEMFRYLDGEWDLPTAIARMQKNTRVYAKKQMTWYQRDPLIHWIDASAQATPTEQILALL